MKIILYEDNQVQNLSPTALTLPSFAILCGGITLYDLVKNEFKKAKIDFLVRDYLAKVTTQRYGRAKAADNQILFLDAALAPDFKTLKFLSQKSFKQSVIFKKQNQILGAY